MRIDKPICCFTNCRKHFDGNCTARPEECEFHALKENEKKYRWHDLRKNPEDLPEEQSKVLVFHEYWHYKAEEMLGEYETAFYAFGLFCFNGGSGQGNKNIAWRYIEPFESEVKDYCSDCPDATYGRCEGCQHER